MTKVSIWLIGMLLLISSTSAQIQVKTISPEELKNLINDCKHDTNYILLDVREVSEVINGIIASEYCKPYHLSFNSKELENNYSILPMDMPIYIYCRSGNRSKQAASFLISKGYQEVYSMDGGINAYKGELYDSTEFKKWRPMEIVEPSFAKGNCTSVLENLNFTGSFSRTNTNVSNGEPSIILNKTVSNEYITFTLQGKSLPEIKTIKIIATYDPAFILIMDAIVSMKIPESVVDVSVDTSAYKIFFTIKGVNNIT
ncbi:MAG: rhodanese-like domain-containing protein, partial [Chitinispirillaceae bacterium]|nr:rhodanese-like domain-containing protein [Chitinispirillaceae bacterium]